MVPEIPSSAPDGPPTGAGGARKRPKYTRSKKGCLTCRSKKIKCDERHPICTRCEHGHRECTWPEAVLPRRPKGAMRGVGNEDEEIGLVDEEGRRQSIPGSAVSTHFPPPSSTTSSHFPGISNNSPFEPAPRRDVFESDGFPAGSQFSVPALPANTRPFYPRPMGAAALPSGEFYPVTAVNGQPIEDYEFPPRQAFGTGASSSAAAGRPAYPNGTLYPGATPGAPTSTGYATDLRRASWDSSAAATDARRPSWDASGAHASSVSSPASSVVGLGLTGGSGGARSVGSSAGNTTAGSSVSGGGSGGPPGGLMLLHSPDPLSPFFRSVQERNLVGNISSFAISSASSSAPLLQLHPSPLSSLNPPLSLTASSSASASSSDLSTSSSILLATQNLGTSSPVLSTASSLEFGVDASGIAYRRSSYPHLYADPQPLTIDPPVPVPLQGINLSAPSINLYGFASATTGGAEDVEWLAPPSVDIYKPLTSPEEEEFISWSAYS
ncbi:hypothetical protein CPB86DRAFT_774944 [Serendipita vermifera]|nr:hypothetical protein CPB86DRAFT_774944 [Serendipita vermifera]